MHNHTLQDVARGRCQYCGASAEMDCYCDLFFSKVNKTKNCWIWNGQKMKTHNNKYGIFEHKGARGKRNRVLAHRFVYVLLKGDIPKDKVVDHICQNGLCVNPDHLQLVTNTENILKGNGAPAVNKRKTHCKNNHELSGDNLRVRKDGKRVCRQCEKDYKSVVGSERLHPNLYILQAPY